jgi:hypothetical protein
VPAAHHNTLPALRRRFLGLAKAPECDDLDAGAIRHGSRALTRAVSAWLYPRGDIDGTEPVAGVEYASRHGDDFTLWARYERDREHDSPDQIRNHTTPQRITTDDSDLSGDADPRPHLEERFLKSLRTRWVTA